MHIRHKLLAATAAGALLLSAGVAFAEGPGTSTGGPGGPGPRGQGGPGMMGGDYRGPGRMGSSTRPMGGDWHGSTTPMMGKDGQGIHGIPGVVMSVGTDGFTMTARGLGKDTASTTLTVTVTSSTKFFKIGPKALPETEHPQMEGSSTPTVPPMMASTTASLADVTVGSKVEVLGKVATSTKTITAERVLIGNDHGMMGRGDDHEGSTTSPSGDTKGFGGFFKKLMNLFGGRGGQNDQTDQQGSQQGSGGPAAAGGIWASILHFFGG